MGLAEGRIRDHLGELVRGTVEEELNAMLDVNAGSKLAHSAEVKLTHPGEEQARARGVVM